MVILIFFLVQSCLQTLFMGLPQIYADTPHINKECREEQPKPVAQQLKPVAQCLKHPNSRDASEEIFLFKILFIDREKNFILLQKIYSSSDSNNDKMYFYKSDFIHESLAKDDVIRIWGKVENISHKKINDYLQSVTDKNKFFSEKGVELNIKEMGIKQINGRIAGFPAGDKSDPTGVRRRLMKGDRRHLFMKRGGGRGKP